MIRPLWFRGLIAVWGMWFAAALAEPAAIFACPMHSAAGVVASSHNPDVGGAASHEAASHEAAHAGQHHPATSAAQHLSTGHASESDAPNPGDHSAGHHCNCLSECCSIVVAQMAREQELFTAQVLPRQAQHVDAPHTVAAPARVAYALPFANGPPPYSA